MRQDYSAAINSLEQIKVSVLPKESRYQLARAFIISESLTQEQKENILENINLKTSDNILNYWIFTGRMEYEESAEIARRMGDEDLLLYALMKQQVSVKSDSNLSGTEKTEKLNAVNSEIDTILDKREQENKELAENSGTTESDVSKPERAIPPNPFDTDPAGSETGAQS